MTTSTLSHAPVRGLERSTLRAERRRKWRAFALIAPLGAFLLAIFVIPIAMLLFRAIENPEVIERLPRTLAALADWDRKSPPPDAAYRALMEDLQAAKDGSATGVLARRLNYEI